MSEVKVQDTAQELTTKGLNTSGTDNRESELLREVMQKKERLNSAIERSDTLQAKYDELKKQITDKEESRKIKQMEEDETRAIRGKKLGLLKNEEELVTKTIQHANTELRNMMTNSLEMMRRFVVAQIDQIQIDREVEKQGPGAIPWVRPFEQAQLEELKKTLATAEDVGNKAMGLREQLAGELQK